MRKKTWTGFMTGVDVRPSELHGLGLFAERVFNKGDGITLFEGKMMSRAEVEELRSKNAHKYVLSLVFGHLYIDGYKYCEMRTGDGCASMANDAYPLGNNAREYRFFDQKTATPKMGLVANRLILPGEEITWRYMQVATQHC
jgi:hypothetical protein